MPLEAGHVWKYQYEAGFTGGVEDVKVSGRSAGGWQLNGPLGPSRLEWRDGKLISAQMAGRRFDPPLPLLHPDRGEGEWTWSGRMSYGTETWTTRFKIVQKKSKYTVAGRPIDALQTTISGEIGGRQYESIQVFGPGIGLVRQEERDGGRFLGAIEYLSGP